MKQFTIGANDAGQRIDRFLSKAMPELKASQIQKGIRTKNIKRNGQRCAAADKLAFGDEIAVYVLPASPLTAEKNYLPSNDFTLDVVFEDENIIVMYKPAGIPCQEQGNTRTLENYMRNHCLKEKSWNPKFENSFVPSLCHRLDVNTSGLVLGAKNAEALRILNEKIKNREIEKKYLAVVYGHPEPNSGVMEDFLFKEDNRVVVHPDRSGGAKTAILTYKTLEEREDLTLVECTLITGRTHQIRVQFASRGYPLLGDGKYGTIKPPYKNKKQALCAYSLKFMFTTGSGTLEYLNGIRFRRGKTFDELIGG